MHRCDLTATHLSLAPQDIQAHRRMQRRMQAALRQRVMQQRCSTETLLCSLSVPVKRREGSLQSCC